MEVFLTHVAGVDVHKEMIAITVLIGKPDETPKVHQWECATYTEDLEACGKKLLSMGVKDVAMESTGIYWKPIYNVWCLLGINITIGNAAHVKNVPGRKTDMKDSQWLATLHRNGLIRASFIPGLEFQQQRLLNRHRTNLAEDIARVKNRVQKVLEDGNVKIGSVLSDVFGMSGIAVLDKIANGVTDVKSLAACIQTDRIKKKEFIQKSLRNCLTKEHCFLIQQLMLQYTNLMSQLGEIDSELEKHVEAHNDVLQRLDEIPGIDRISARGILAEASTNMEAFKSDRHFAAWAGVASGNNESAKKKKEVDVDMAIPS